MVGITNKIIYNEENSMDPRDIYFKTISKKMSENYTVRGFAFSAFQTKEA